MEKVYDWEKFSWPSEDFSVKAKIYLSSLEDINLFNFYRHFNGRLKLFLLTPENIGDALNGVNSLLIYSEDIFPPCRKISIHELWEKLHSKKLGNMLKFCYFPSDLPVLKVNELSTAGIIRKFDSGAFTVTITDDSGNFAGVITREDFSRNFPRRSVSVCSDIFLRWSENETQIKVSAVEQFLSAGLRELPIVRSEKATSSCRIGNELLTRDCEENFPPCYWDMLSDDVIVEFLEDRKHILISSMSPPLEGFYEHFRHFADITVFDDPVEKFINEDFDFLVYIADVWDNFPCVKFSAQKLYANLLAEEIRRFLDKHSVRYFYVEAPERFQSENTFRTEYSQRMNTSLLTFGSPEDDYLVHSDKIAEGWSTAGGIRLIPGSPQNFDQQIFMFGPCSVIGTFADDEHTIAALLQQYLNDRAEKFRVINCGNNGGFSGASVNELYRIADTGFCAGDIVIHINGGVWCYAFRENLCDKFSLSDIFSSSGVKFSKPFRDSKSGHHLNAQGNEIIAEFLSLKITSRAECEQKDTAFIPSMFSSVPNSERLIRSPGLKNFLAGLEKERVPAQNVGAVVMNCNPFTLGHKFLIESACKQTDFLYVFVVEEDCSEFDFKSRFQLVQEGCSSLKNIKVLPGGKYMISLVTFADYFHKEALQGKSVIAPAADVKIFAQAIAPVLGIRKRFAGTEPLDTLTEKYNLAMKILLPEFGIKFIEIPRLTAEDGEIISASATRRLLKQGQIEACKKFLPLTTWEYIRKRYEDKK